jgi:hypothetical protein
MRRSRPKSISRTIMRPVPVVVAREVETRDSGCPGEPRLRGYNPAAPDTYDT